MPYCYLLMLFALIFFSNAAPRQPGSAVSQRLHAGINPYSSVGAIPVPAGFTRVPVASGSFAGWLRQLPLKKNKKVYIFDGTPKANQTAQFAVIDITVGHKDLQQCADAVMRLRAEYLYAQKRWSEIDFTDNRRTHYHLLPNADRNAFNQYLDRVFSFCGTASLDKQLVNVQNFSLLSAGDVLIKGGSPGHAMQVLDVALNKEGKKIYLLAQSYMPAQDMHVVVNPANSLLSPWYEINSMPFIETPEWIFKQSNLKKWP